MIRMFHHYQDATYEVSESLVVLGCTHTHMAHGPDQEREECHRKMGQALAEIHDAGVPVKMLVRVVVD